MPAIRITELTVKRKPPAQGRIQIADAVVPGLYLRISSSDVRSWSVVYRVDGWQRRVTIGRADGPRALSIPDARTRAREILGSPDTERPAAIPTFGDFVETYLTRVTPRLRPKSLAELRRQLKSYLLPKLADYRLDEIDRRQLAAIVHDVGGRAPVMANRLRSTLATIFKHAVEAGILATEPGLPKTNKEKSREREPSVAEVAAIWAGAETLGYPFGPLIKLLILTGQRRSTVAAMAFDEIDLDTGTWTIPASKMKTGRSHEVALSGLAIDVLKSCPRRLGTELVFTVNGLAPITGFSRAKTALDAAITVPIPPWTYHDLRRALVSGIAELGFPPHVADKILAHSTGPIRGVAAVYNRFQYRDERRAALDAWSDRIAALTGENVVELTRAGA